MIWRRRYLDKRFISSDALAVSTRAGEECMLKDYMFLPILLQFLTRVGKERNFKNDLSKKVS